MPRPATRSQARPDPFDFLKGRMRFLTYPGYERAGCSPDALTEATAHEFATIVAFLERHRRRLALIDGDGLRHTDFRGGEHVPAYDIDTFVITEDGRLGIVGH